MSTLVHIILTGMLCGAFAEERRRQDWASATVFGIGIACGLTLIGLRIWEALS